MRHIGRLGASSRAVRDSITLRRRNLSHATDHRPMCPIPHHKLSWETRHEGQDFHVSYITPAIPTTALETARPLG